MNSINILKASDATQLTKVSKERDFIEKMNIIYKDIESAATHGFDYAIFTLKGYDGNFVINVIEHLKMSGYNIMGRTIEANSFYCYWKEK